MHTLYFLFIFAYFLRNTAGFNVTVNTTSIRTLQKRFLSITLDSLSASPDTWNYLNFTFMAPLARAFGSSYFRFGGTYSDLMAFNETFTGPLLQQYPWCIPNTIYGSKCAIFTANQFETLYNFSHAAGWRFIFDLNLMLRNGTGWTAETIHNSSWDSSNAKKLLDYASTRNFAMDWELGNEPDGFQGLFNNLTLTATQLVEAYAQLRALMDTYTLYKNSILIGPSASGINWVIPEFVNASGGKYVNALTAHHYYFFGGTAKLQDFLNHTIMQDYINRAPNSPPLWNGETSSAWDGGAPNMSDKYVAGFLWLDKLGMSALYGIDLVLRQTFVGAGGAFAIGRYTLLNANLKPNPDYWLSFLYKKLIGSNVLNLTVDQPDVNLRLYAASSKNLNGFVIYGQYMGNSSITIDIPQIANKNVALYVLKEGEDGNIQSDSVKLNGKLISWNTHLPTPFQGLSTNLPVTVPEISLFYIVAQPETAQNCPQGWYQEKTVSNKCLKNINYTQPWFSANFDCTTYGFNASLLSIDSAFENSEIGQFAQNSGCNQFYLGLYQNGQSWGWSNSDTNTYRNWKSGFPTNDNTQLCAIYDQASGSWTNSDCDSSQCYICQIVV